MSIPKHRIIIPIIGGLIVIAVVTAGWLLFNAGQWVPNYYIVPKILVHSQTESTNQFANTTTKYSLTYPKDWIIQENDSYLRSDSFAQAKKSIEQDPTMRAAETSRTMVGSFKYPFDCGPGDTSLELCAGHKLPTGAFLDIHTDYRSQTTADEIIAAERKAWNPADTITDSPIQVAGKKTYEWTGLDCGQRCYLLRALIVPIRDHQAMTLFATVYVGEEVSRQDLQMILSNYQTELDTMIASIQID